jgi:hypothetical protein
LQGKSRCAAEFIAAGCLNDEFPQAGQPAVQPDAELAFALFWAWVFLHLLRPADSIDLNQSP